MRVFQQLFAALAVLVFTSCNSQAGFIIASTYNLAPNQNNQVINILASPSFAGEVAPGLNFNFVVDDGGSVIGGIDNNSPKIVSINLKPTGGLFASIPDVQANVFVSQKLYQVTIAPTNVANRPVITTNVLLAQVTLDTTGLASGNWVLDLDGIPSRGFPSSDFAGIATTVVNGSIAVPEPSSLSTLSLVGSIAAIFRFRRRRKTSNTLSR